MNLKQFEWKKPDAKKKKKAFFLWFHLHEIQGKSNLCL